MSGWKDIEGYEGRYQVNIYGQVRNLLNTRGNKLTIPRVVKAQKSPRGGCLTVMLTKHNKRKVFKIHRLIYHHFIAPVNSKQIINHTDGNILNNNIENLRIASHSQANAHSASRIKNTTSKYKCVSWNTAKCKWIVQVGFKNKTIYIGQYDCEIEAARIANKAMISYYGKYARLNIL